MSSSDSVRRPSLLRRLLSSLFRRQDGSPALSLVVSDARGKRYHLRPGGYAVHGGLHHVDIFHGGGDSPDGYLVMALIRLHSGEWLKLDLWYYADGWPAPKYGSAFPITPELSPHWFLLQGRWPPSWNKPPVRRLTCDTEVPSPEEGGGPGRSDIPTADRCLMPDRRVRWRGVTQLQHRLYTLLTYLLKVGPGPVPRDQIESAVWGEGVRLNESTMPNALSRLNNALERVAWPWSWHVRGGQVWRDG